MSKSTTTTTTNGLDDEYSTKAARDQLHRDAHRQRIDNQRRSLEAEPIQDEAELSKAVRQLAGAWGLKRKGRKG